MIHSRPQPSIFWCVAILLIVAVSASWVGLGSSDSGSASVVNILFYVFIGLFVISFFFVLRRPRD